MPSAACCVHSQPTRKVQLTASDSVCHEPRDPDLSLAFDPGRMYIYKRSMGMACTAAVRQADDVSIVDLAGRLTLGDGSWKLRDIVRDLIRRGERRILLNLHDITFIDSAGLGELVGSYANMV